MIGYLSGVIKRVTPRGVLVDVQGVGYRVAMNAGDLSRAMGGATAELFCHTIVREDAIQLVGFFNEHARDFFEVLIGVSGVGPKSGLLILSVGTVDEVRTAIEQGDVGFLTSVPGIGKKIAERIILELRGKLPDFDAPAAETPHAVAAEALANLGYRKDEALAAVRNLTGTTESLIRQGLQKLHG
ncbi:MAG: Holliday junction DNA helicase RuvA [Candidatus Magasanikbacteria bacterium RIFCSPHIGHO2_02_FULL_50_9b]|uniref:Holliday junction branch migration complex subunit RuvA n=1 Tax=Candidatus Magasanikbacteria bacterium RIFCSPHIGHO2_02_FULL_50_9b TaxID=1798682 RepID=A0A1F6M992_9BACT|nr:MAG: Holliday junction DNA helicase RuvA [Candidatus Magasanikbacteria bacterium RIFCSPHIGHO2_02_FULL_50_9b]